MENDGLTKKSAFLTPRCEELLEEALTYIAVDSPRQAEIMEEQFSETRRIIERMPGIGTKYGKGMRRTGLGKFRKYNVYYREKENLIEILGIWHTSRGTEFEEG